MVSARMAPMTKAPNAVEKPAYDASTTMPKQSPTATMQSVSSVMYLRIQRKKVGIRKMPKVNHTIRKKTSFTRLMASSPPLKLLLTDTVERITNSKTATMSSTTSTAVTDDVNFCCFSFKSSNDLIMIDVEEMESIQPRKTHSIEPHPSSRPTLDPIKNMIASSVSAVMAPVEPTFFNFLRLNSRPKANIRKTMPMSLHTWTLATSSTAGNQGK